MEKDPSYSSNNSSSVNNSENKSSSGYASSSVPQITLPKGGGSIRSIDEKFSVNAANGTSGYSIPFPFSPSRNGFMPGMTLGYNSGIGNSVFGLGWNAEPAAIVRKTDKQLPQYNDGIDSDIFVFSGSEDLVPAYNKDASGNWIKDSSTANGVTITRYKPRLEAGFARIEKITELNGNIYWKVTTGSNVVSVFGKSKSAQVVNPADSTNIFKWLLEFSYDDKGNCFQYEYKKEDKVNVQQQLHEKNRLNNFSLCTNIYLKRIKYCNKVHFNRSSIDLFNWDTFLSNLEYLLELVVDYGEHDLTNPQPGDDNGWTCRTDPFSDYRAGFEIRTYRLCQRVLMFHRFIELGTTPCLVSSLDIDYDSGGAFTFLKSVSSTGYIRKPDGSYSQKSLPPLEFSYEQLGWDTEIRSLPSGSADNLPIGIDDEDYQWVDLYKEGMPGILTEQAGAWHYKINAGNGNFEGTKLIPSKPSLGCICAGTMYFADIEANGQQSLVSKELRGYFELDDDNQWLPFKSFTETPNVRLNDPNLKYIDLNGDGMADILISEESLFTWYEAKGKEGFENYKRLSKALDEEKGPNMIFADTTESIILADMSGDGLMDIVRIRCSEVVYWPNLGYGRFGAKVNMSNSPVFDNEENFNPRYIKLADIDGSGTTDIIYLGHNTFKIYFNQSGNSLGEINVINGVNPLPFPQINDHNNISIIDLLGNGTGCIVWSSPMPQHTGQQLQYIDLMGGKKPHILTSYKNNMGKEVFVEYKPSTFFFLQDKKTGTPWITKLPFPVQCVSQTVMVNQITKTRFTSQYSYHHGYYDHHEREFRGFGRVDKTDAEDFENFKKHADPGGVIQLVDEGFHQPPALTKTWFHTGAFLDKEKVLGQFAHEYYSNNIIPEKQLIDPALPADLTIDEWREALRSCKGLVLRNEVYSLDKSDKQEHPYTTSNLSCLIQLLQPKLQNENSVFMVQQSESVAYIYERNPADPRIAHSMTIETDEFGKVLKAAAVSYGRKTSDNSLTSAEQAEQSKTHIIFSQSNFTNRIDTASDYHLPLGYESLSFELTGLVPATGDYFSIEDIENGFTQATTINYQSLPAAGIKQKRLIEHARARFLNNDMSTALPLGVIESLALPHESAKLSMTPDLRDFIYGGKVNDALLLGEGKYVHFDDGNYWVTSGTQKLDAINFYQVMEITDPLGLKVNIQYDSKYRLFVQKTTDALNNETSVLGFNYRTLSPYLMKDINDNRAGVRTDELGMVISSYVMGKESENKGDLMDGLTVEASVNDQPSSVLEYDLFTYKNVGKPNFIKITIHETHYNESIQSGISVKSQISYAYADGGGGIIMHKTQAEPGPALQENTDGTVTEVDTTPNLRWIGNGRTIVNNKGQTVKQYEPYFSTTFEFEDAKQLVERGVTPFITYDTTGRVIRTDMPDGTFARIEFDSWMQSSFDPNDTVLESQWYKDRITSPVGSIATPEEVDAANKAAVHANTPMVTFLDSLGRNFISIADNGDDGKYKVRSVVDIESNLRSVTDAAGNLLIQFKHDMLGAPLYHSSMDTGEQWLINDVMGKPLRNWDNKNNVIRYESDTLHRPIRIFVQQGSEPERCTERIIFGETLGNAKDNNLRGAIYKQYDTAGVAISNGIDFKGNLLSTTKQLLKNYKGNVDWNVMSDDDLEQETFTSTSAFDAINRPLQAQITGGNVIRQVYNESGGVNQVFVSIKGMTEIPFVKDIDYDEKGQRQKIIYGNDTKTSYRYDRQTFRLTQLVTTGNDGTTMLQQLQYTYDPVGNLSFIKDRSQSDIFFNNTIVKAENDYIYDAIYRLIQASGREQVGQNLINELGSNNNLRNFPFESGANANDMQAMRNYVQEYSYDATGNMLQLKHVAGLGSYTRVYKYNNNDADRNSLNIAPETIKNNQLLATNIGDNTIHYQYDVHGNMTNQPHLQRLTWNFREELQQIDLGGGGTVYYVYDGNGNRVRKIIERLNGATEERIYINGFELYRKKDGTGTLQEQTETVHVMDDTKRIAMVETKTIEAAVNISNLQPLIRYQYGNHLGSSSLELDENATIISFEEYHPYGTTSTVFNNIAIVAAAKRYRYTGMERDEESGLACHGARYYLPWLGRWLSPDPSYYKDSFNIYKYAHCNPVRFADTTGNESREEITGFLTAATTVIRNVHRVPSDGHMVLTSDGLEKAIYEGFVKMGEAAMSNCSTKVDKLTLFDKGAAIFAKRYHVEKLFNAAAEEGDFLHSRQTESAIEQIEEFIPVQDKLGATYFVRGPLQGTRQQNEQYTFARESTIYLLPIAVGELLAAADGKGIPGEGGAPASGSRGSGGSRGSRGSRGLRESGGSRGSRTRVTGESGVPEHISEQPTAKISRQSKGTKAAPNTNKAPADPSALILAISDTQSVAQLADRIGARVALTLEGQDLSGITRLTVKAHLDISTGTIEIDGKNYTPEQFANKLVKQGFGGGEVRLISCFSGLCTAGGSFAEKFANHLEFLGAESGVAAAGGMGGTAPTGPNIGLPIVSVPGATTDANGLLNYPTDFLPPGHGWVFR